MGSYFEKNRKRYAFLSAIWSVILLLIGLFLLIKPGTALVAICLMIGIALIAFGAYFIIFYIVQSSRIPEYTSVYALIGGFFLLIMGIVFTVHPRLIANFASIVLAVSLMAYGVNDFVEMQSLRLLEDSRWYLSLITGIATFVLGILILLHPFSTQELIMRLAGIAFIYAAVSGLFLHARVHSFANKAEESMRDFTEEVREAKDGRKRYDKNGQEIIDSTATEEEMDSSDSASSHHSDT